MQAGAQGGAGGGIPPPRFEARGGRQGSEGGQAGERGGAGRGGGQSLAVARLILLLLITRMKASYAHRRICICTAVLPRLPFLGFNSLPAYRFPLQKRLLPRALQLPTPLTNLKKPYDYLLR